MLLSVTMPGTEHCVGPNHTWHGDNGRIHPSVSDWLITDQGSINSSSFKTPPLGKPLEKRNSTTRSCSLSPSEQIHKAACQSEGSNIESIGLEVLGFSY